MSLENVLGLSKEEIQIRIDEEIRRLASGHGVEYLNAKASRFSSPEWKFLSYLAQSNPPVLMQVLNQYGSDEGNVHKEVLLESLREGYILGKLILEFGPKTPAVGNISRHFEK